MLTFLENPKLSPLKFLIVKKSGYQSKNIFYSLLFLRFERHAMELHCILQKSEKRVEAVNTSKELHLHYI